MNSIFPWIVEHRVQLYPLLFGFVALYLLLPRERPFLRPVGIVLGLIGLAALAFTLQSPGMTVHGFLFFIFAATAILAGASTVTNHNPVYSALSFAVTTLSVCGLFLLRGAQFLAAATVIIYAGAVVVTFLFIIMLARQSGNAGYDRRAREPFLATVATFVLLGGLLFTIDRWAVQRRAETANPKLAERQAAVEIPGAGARSAAGFVPIVTNPHAESLVKPNDESHLRGLGRALFTDYLVAIELAGTLLLVAGVGAVSIASRRASRSP